MRSLTASFDALASVKYRTNVFLGLSPNNSPLKHTVQFILLSTNDSEEKDGHKPHKHYNRWYLAGLLGGYALTSRVLKAGESHNDEEIINKTNGRFSRTAAQSKSEQMERLRSVKRKLKYPEENESASFYLTQKKMVRKSLLFCITISA